MNATRNLIALIETLLDGGEMGVREIGARTGIPKSTAQRLLAQLEEGGWVAMDKRTHAYRTGAALLCRAGGWTLRAALLERSSDVLDGLARTCGRPASLSVPDGCEGRVLRVSTGAAMPQMPLFALSGTAAGMALLAYAADSLRQYVLRSSAESAALAAEIDIVRARGWAVRGGDLAVPMTAHGRVIAALSLGPADDAQPPDVCLTRLKSAAAKLVKRALAG